MPLPTLTHWETTSPHLHKAAFLVGAVRLLTHEHKPNYLELGMKVVPEGISSDTLAAGGELILDFANCAYLYKAADGKEQTIPINGQSQANLLKTLLKLLKLTDLKSVLGDLPDETIVDEMFKMTSQWQNRVKPDPQHLTDTTPIAINPDVARDYADIQFRVFTAMARYRARLMGPMTPIVVWPEHFDMASLWFSTEKADENEPHLGYGMAPFSPGIPRPYIYMYAYPYPESYTPPTLPDQVKWETDAYTGPYLSYDTIANQPDPEQFVEDSLAAMYEMMAPLLK